MLLGLSFLEVGRVRVSELSLEVTDSSGQAGQAPEAARQQRCGRALVT